jgi:RND superfamily putative drug exporter
MKLLGDWNWYLPEWLEWLPRVGPGHGGGLPPAPEQPAAPPEEVHRAPIRA